VAQQQVPKVAGPWAQRRRRSARAAVVKCTIAHSAKVMNTNNLNTGPTAGRENGPGPRDSRRTAAQRMACQMRSPRICQGTLRGALLPLGDGHVARR
jgi:hypothetical protein